MLIKLEGKLVHTLLMNYFILIFPEVIIGFVKTKLTVSEGDAMAVVSVQILKGTLRSNITIQLFMDDDSATSISECCQYTLIYI